MFDDDTAKQMPKRSKK